MPYKYEQFKLSSKLTLPAYLWLNTNHLRNLRMSKTKKNSNKISLKWLEYKISSLFFESFYKCQNCYVMFWKSRGGQMPQKPPPGCAPGVTPSIFVLKNCSTCFYLRLHVIDAVFLSAWISCSNARCCRSGFEMWKSIRHSTLNLVTF